MTEIAVSTDRSPDDDDGDSVAAFSAALRDLRSAAGDPTLAALSARTGISKSVLSEALTGRRLPTERTVMKLVAEFGGDRAQWRARRDALDPRYALAMAGTEPESPPPAAARRFSLVQTALIAVGAAAVAAVATSLVWGFAVPGGAGAETPANAEGPYLAAANGVDPMRTACKEDAVIAADESRLDNQVHVQLLYSNDCMAVWGRVTRYDGESDGNSMSMKIWPADAPESIRNQERSDVDLQSLYTPMIIEPDVEARICGVATVTADGETFELGPPLCV